MTDHRCGTCGEPCSWADWRFGGHCTPRKGPATGQSLDARVEGKHPGLGYVADAADLKRKVEAAKRAGYTVQRAKDIRVPERPLYEPPSRGT